MLRILKRPVAFFSKQLDEISKEWPACLWSVEAAALLNQKTWNLPLRQPITAMVLHELLTIIKDK